MSDSSEVTGGSKEIPVSRCQQLHVTILNQSQTIDIVNVSVDAMHLRNWWFASPERMSYFLSNKYLSTTYFLGLVLKV